MKKLIAVVLCLLMLLSSAFAEDLSAMTMEELIELRDRINAEIMSRAGDGFTLDVGVWEVGKDLPEGRWSITADKDNYLGWGVVTYCSELDSTGKKAGNMWYMDEYYSSQVRNPDVKAAVSATTLDIDMKAGNYVIIEYSPMIFTPYTGNTGESFTTK